jgi:hypothetical protein
MRIDLSGSQLTVGDLGYEEVRELVTALLLVRTDSTPIQRLQEALAKRVADRALNSQ